MTTQRLTRRQALRRRRIVVLTGLLLVVLGLSTVLVRAGQAVWAAASDALTTRAAIEATGPNSPARLTIDDIGLDHQLVPGGLSESGAIDPDRGELMWFDGGDRAVPGDVGIAIIAGHVEYYGEPDVFADLEGVEPGDEFSLTQQDGDELELTVLSTDLVDKEELRRSDLVWGQEDERRLVALVTCDDDLGYRADGHRTANLVVIAEVSQL
ncbi:class F sortase [Ornithinimicrobium panacihumi]|uniref:class F sortase n=1 Tax=Ornithinimicrobium panacihumi TaxID=2008449 RepID=UPI003F8C768D